MPLAGYLSAMLRAPRASAEKSEAPTDARDNVLCNDIKFLDCIVCTCVCIYII